MPIATPIKIKNITLHYVSMDLVSPFATSYGTMLQRDFIVTELTDEDGIIGWGECVAFSDPWYTEETIQTANHIMKDYLIPILLSSSIIHPEQLTEWFAGVRRHPMAKSALEGAVWDIYAQKRQLSLSAAIGGNKTQIESGISIGLQQTLDQLFDVIDRSQEAGYKRVKLKIKPGKDVDIIASVRARYPHLAIMADANSAYTLQDVELLKELDQYNLTMIEQPLAFDDYVDHAELQAQIKTPICLDESIQSFADAKRAIKLGSCQTINIKIGRVGGLSEAIKIHDYCQDSQMPVWCGGMLEAGIGRAYNIALSSLPGFSIAGDTSASSRYWRKDIIEPEVFVENGFIDVPLNKPGIGFTVNRKILSSFTTSVASFRV